MDIIGTMTHPCAFLTDENGKMTEVFVQISQDNLWLRLYDNADGNRELGSIPLVAILHLMRVCKS